MRATSMHEAYRGLLCEIMNHGVEEVNARTGVRIKMLRGGHSFKLRLDEDLRLPVAGNRRYYPHVAAAETAWQFMGTKDPSFIVGKAPKLWSKFVEIETTHVGTVSTQKEVLKTAYGWRWREAFGRDQIALTLDELANNPTNRQLFISAWDPSSDGLGGPQPKNIPCPVGFCVSRFEDELHMSVFIRSSDVFVGLPYDTMCYALTLDAFAATLGCKPGTLTMTMAHPHIYEPHFSSANACLFGLDRVACVDLEKERGRYEGASTEWTGNVRPSLPAWTVDQIVTRPDDYVDAVKLLAGRVNRNTWDPYPELIE